jgi:hypothetical protein
MPEDLNYYSWFDLRDLRRRTIHEYSKLDSVMVPDEAIVTGASIVKSQVDLLCWYKTEVRSQLLKHSETISKQLNLQSHEEMRLFKLDPLSTLFENLPESALALAIRENWKITLTISRLNWENTVNTKLFSTLIARVFSNSFDSGNIKQDFKLGYELNSLMDTVHGNNYSAKDWAMRLHSDRGINTFNSTTIGAFILNALVKYWDSLGPKKLMKHQNNGDFWCSMYKKVAKKLVNRRGGNELDFVKTEKDFKRLKKILQSNNPFWGEQNKSYEEIVISELAANGFKAFPATAKHKKAAQAKVEKLMANGLPINAIIYSNCSEMMPDGVTTDKRLAAFTTAFVSKPPRSDWLSWSPRIRK